MRAELNCISELVIANRVPDAGQPMSDQHKHKHQQYPLTSCVSRNIQYTSLSHPL